MFGKRIELFRLFGFAIRLDASWFLLAVLITWSLATSLFPALRDDLAPRTYWLMGGAGMLGLFASIVLHEVGHSLLARRFGLPMRGITLFIFGGVAEMEDEPPSPRAEFWVAVAGPAVSIGLAGLLWIAAQALGGGGTEASMPPAALVLGYLASLNGLLVGFNLVPAFPLDGGRVLRSILWRARGSLRQATRRTSQIGAFFGWLLVGLGLLSLISGNLVGGLWWTLIGLFLKGAASSSYQHLLVRQTLEGEPVRRFMARDPVTVPAETTVADAVEDYIYQHHFKMFPVTRGDTLVGCVTTRQIREVPRDQWSTRTVGELATSCSPDNCVAPETDAMRALAIMSRGVNSRLLVAEGDRLVGVIALKDLMGFLARKLELEDDESIGLTGLDLEGRQDRAA